MGRLTDIIERMHKTAAPRLGFAQVGATKQPSLLLVAVLPTASRSLATAAVNAGADCLLIQQVDGAAETSLRDKLGIAGSVLCGAVLSDQAANADGWDFAVVEPSAPVEPFLGAERTDHVFSIQADTPDSILRTLESLPIDAVVMSEPATPLTLQGLISYYRVTKVTSKPVLGSIPTKSGPGLLRALRDAGVAGVLAEMNSVTGAKVLGELRKAIDQLPARKPKSNRTRMAVALGMPPAVAAAAAPEAPPDEGDEGDDQ